MWIWSPEVNSTMNLCFNQDYPATVKGALQHNYSTKTRQAGRVNEESILTLLSMSPAVYKQAWQ